MYRNIYDALEKNGTVKSAVVLEGADAGRRIWLSGDRVLYENGEDAKRYRAVLTQAKETGIVEHGDECLFLEVYSRNPRLVILGGGHVSRPVAHIGHMLGFSVTVMDDREEFLTEERFPEARERICGSFDELSRKIPDYPNTYYVVVTRGHAGDTVCARQILKRTYKYFGMIGSRRKVSVTREALLREGFPKEMVDSIHAPIGLPIGGETPEEIAVSILAEIIQVKKTYRESYMEGSVLKAVQQGLHGVMATVIRKEGSSPRGVGSKMFLDEHGIFYGSIGGGSVEYEAQKFMKSANGMSVQSYQLSPGDERNLGMICGGKLDVLFECI